MWLRFKIWLAAKLLAFGNSLARSVVKQKLVLKDDSDVPYYGVEGEPQRELIQKFLENDRDRQQELAGIKLTSRDKFPVEKKN